MTFGHEKLDVYRTALECAAVQDVLDVNEVISNEQNGQGKVLLDRIVAMLTKMGGRGYSVQELEGSYCSVHRDGDCDGGCGSDIDYDCDTDSDTDIDTDCDSDTDTDSEKKMNNI